MSWEFQLDFTCTSTIYKYLDIYHQICLFIQIPQLQPHLCRMLRPCQGGTAPLHRGLDIPAGSCSQNCRRDSCTELLLHIVPKPHTRQYLHRRQEMMQGKGKRRGTQPRALTSPSQDTHLTLPSPVRNNLKSPINIKPFFGLWDELMPLNGLEP